MLVIFLFCSVALIARAVNLQVMETDFLQGQGKARYLREVTIPSTRGVISDRNGEPLGSEHASRFRLGAPLVNCSSIPGKIKSAGGTY